MVDRKYCIYMHLFPDEKPYIGLTCQKPEVRWGHMGNGYKGQPKIYNAIQNFGWENVSHIILESGLTAKEAQEEEMRYIEKFDSIVYGYNSDIGGGLGGNEWKLIPYKGREYTPSELVKLSPLDDLTPSDITTRLSHGWSIKRVLNQPKQDRGKLYPYNGKEYPIGDLFDMRINKDITYRQFVTRVIKHHWDIERAMTQPNNVKEQPHGIGDKIYEYNGIMYNSYELSQISKIDGITPFMITDRINHHGWSVEDAISKPLKKMNQLFQYNGKEYDSHELASICIDSSMTYHDVTDRNRIGWTTWEIVNIPKGMTRKKFYRENSN